jgi:hypothetical protein
MVVKCPKCESPWEVPPASPDGKYRCGKCGSSLPGTPEAAGETSAAVGALGGAALGAAIAGPVGAVIGGIVGGIIGSQAKGLG